jgi:tRNA (guanosine-2'-O-)-methyltransferase
MKSKLEDLSADSADRMVALLAPFVSERRRDRIESALASRTRDVVLVLEDIHNDHNSSAVMRTAEALGILELHVIAERSAFSVSDKISSGAHKWLDIRGHDSVASAYAHLRRRGYQIWASHFHGEAQAGTPPALPIDQIPVDLPIALVFGNELEGLTSDAIEHADHWFRVPMYGFVESLNISVAAAISMYDVRGRRQREGLLRGLSDEDVRRLRAAWYAMSVRAAELILAQAGLPFPEMSSQPMTFVEEEEV